MKRKRIELVVVIYKFILMGMQGNRIIMEKLLWKEEVGETKVKSNLLLLKEVVRPKLRALVWVHW